MNACIYENDDGHNRKEVVVVLLNQFHVLQYKFTKANWAIALLALIPI